MSNPGGRTSPRSRWILTLALLPGLIACQRQLPKPASSPPPTPTTSPSLAGSPQTETVKPGPVEFVDVTPRAGINFNHNNGATGKMYLPERLGSGCAFLDYDNDGWQDILLINAADFADASKRRRSVMALYHNNQNGTFVDVTGAVGLARPIYGIGVAVADFDNDGWTDIFITGLGQSCLYRNIDGGRFEDVTTRMRLSATPSFPTTAIWFDYDKDGKLDLFISGYADWSIERDVFCSNNGALKTYCTAGSYAGQTSRLYRNLGPLFEDVTRQSKLEVEGKSLAAAVVDYDRDGWPDLFVTNEGEPNRLYHNNGRGQFTETAEIAGIAIGQAGKARTGRGVDVADYDRSGYPSFAIAHSAGEMPGLYHNEGKFGGLFVDEGPDSLPGEATRQGNAFSVLFFDYDLDGWPDILFGNGGQALQLFRNLGKRKFEDVSRAAGKPFRLPLNARGAAYGDYDRDGDLDLLVTTNGGPAYLLRNERGSQNHFLHFRTVGTDSNRQGLGTRIAIFLPDGSRLWNYVRSSSGYCSQSWASVTFGLGRVDRVPRVEIEWPSGKTEKIENLAADRFYTIKEGSGILP